MERDLRQARRLAREVKRRLERFSQHLEGRDLRHRYQILVVQTVGQLWHAPPPCKPTEPFQIFLEGISDLAKKNSFETSDSSTVAGSVWELPLLAAAARQIAVEFRQSADRSTAWDISTGLAHDVVAVSNIDIAKLYGYGSFIRSDGTYEGPEPYAIPTYQSVIAAIIDGVKSLREYEELATAATRLFDALRAEQWWATRDARTIGQYLPARLPSLARSLADAMRTGDNVTILSQFVPPRHVEYSVMEARFYGGYDRDVEEITHIEDIAGSITIEVVTGPSAS